MAAKLYESVIYLHLRTRPPLLLRFHLLLRPPRLPPANYITEILLK